jgi:hypothetical protein
MLVQSGLAVGLVAGCGSPLLSSSQFREFLCDLTLPPPPAMSRSLFLALVVVLAFACSVSASLPMEAIVAPESLLANAADVQQGQLTGVDSKFNATDANGWVLYKQVRETTERQSTEDRHMHACIEREP